MGKIYLYYRKIGDRYNILKFATFTLDELERMLFIIESYD